MTNMFRLSCEALEIGRTILLFRPHFHKIQIGIFRDGTSRRENADKAVFQDTGHGTSRGLLVHLVERGELVVLRSRNFNSLGLTGLNNTGDIAKELGDNSLRGPFSKQLCFCSHFPSLPDSDHHPSPAPSYLVLRIIFDTYSGRQKYCTLLHVQYLHNA